MQVLNPFLNAFFKSPIVAQCSPVHHHILLVPLTDVLLTTRETENGASLQDTVASDEFLSSHVLRILAPEKDVGQSLRDVRGKAKQFSTLNGRSVVIKDSVVYSNKGFKSLVQAQLLNDATWYPDVFEPRQWLIYYISKPLVGTWEEVRAIPAVQTPDIRQIKAMERQKVQNGESASKTTGPRKKDVQNFHDLLTHFPMIARHMRPNLENLFVEFSTVVEKNFPSSSPSTNIVPDSSAECRSVVDMSEGLPSSLTTQDDRERPGSLPVNENFYAEDDEDIMRASLETAVTTAIDLFQSVDKQQLSLLGATTDLTGPLVEKLIERYVTEHLHHQLFPKLSGLRRPMDLELEAKIRHMEYIDITQLGLEIDGGSKAKHDLLVQLCPVIEEFKKITHARSPAEMMDTLLSTMKSVSQLTNTSKPQDGHEPASEKAMMTVNADTLVSLLLYVIIRSQVKNLQARLIYMRSFIFVDDIDSGEMGYALSTFEAVLSYLSLDSAGLRKASKINKSLWDVIKHGNLHELKNIMEPSTSAVECDDHSDFGVSHAASKATRRPSFSWVFTNGSSRRPSFALSVSDRFSHGSNLSHVFPFQSTGGYSRDFPPAKKIKRVAMDTRSLSSSSEHSLHSCTGSIGTLGSVIEGDVSVERLARTGDSSGESILMMAVQNGQAESLRYLLSLSVHFPVEFVLEDMNNEDTSLLSAAIQLGHSRMIDMILDHISSLATCEQLARYLSEQDIWGRSVGHYLFHTPSLIDRIGSLIPWRQRDKNGQTPLFALCRSYDHANYHDMIESGLRVAREAQGDRLPLHIDEHVDGKGNTLLHIINEPRLALRILQCCDVDVNATNDRRFTALMVASKYGRYDMVRCLFADPRVDVGAREMRGLTAVELAKDDDVRNKIDDLSLFSMPVGRAGRITSVVRAFFVEDGSVRLVLKSAAPTDHDSYTVTTSRRSLNEFEQLAHLLASEHPASWMPSIADTRSPFQLPTKPSRAILRDIQTRMDWFLRVMLDHPTLATHEMLWEFFLVPELQLDVMEQRTKLKAEMRLEKIKEEFEPVEDVRDVEQFVNHAREMVRGVSFSIKNTTRRANGLALATCDMYDSIMLLHWHAAAAEYIPSSHARALERYGRALMPTQSNPQRTLHTTLLAMQSTVQAMLSALGRPGSLISQISAAQREADRNENVGGRASRWPLGLLDETRQRLQDGKKQRARKWRQDAEMLSRELRFTQQTVASELAGWQEMHEKMGRQAIREFARGMVVQERMRLDGMIRALSNAKPLRPGGPGLLSAVKNGALAERGLV
ncbi:hypothetical protein RJ55_06848 [Drechmeria coniospora]|nr:hypothetical protein RJ55_06848 [Drechmeria coniospora]